MTEIGPTLGQRAFDISIMVGAIAIVFVMIFMLVFYRLPSNCEYRAYCIYGIDCACYGRLGITITLPV